MHACAGHAPTSMPVSGGEDRLTVNWAEWRKGYSYLVHFQPLGNQNSHAEHTLERGVLRSPSAA